MEDRQQPDTDQARDGRRSEMGAGPGTPAPADPAPRDRRRRRRRGVAVTVAAAAAVGGAGIGTGITLGASGVGATTTRSPVRTARPLSTAALDPSAVPKASVSSPVNPAVVDITSVLSNGEAAGTGMILTPSGQVLTNNHVVRGASKILVTISGHAQPYQATVLGVDPSADVALLQIHGVSGLPTVALGNSSTATVGQPVVAIGNALNRPGPPTVTTGVISALHRSITAGSSSSGWSEHLTNLIQTNAPIRPGDSGGPLLTGGKVIGMDTAAATGSPATNVGFAIPINSAQAVVATIRSGHPTAQVHIGPRAILGVVVQGTGAPSTSGASPYPGVPSTGGTSPYPGLAPTGAVAAQPASAQPSLTQGALVVGVVPGTPAATAGLHPGDVIVSLGGHAIGSTSALTKAMSQEHPGATVGVSWVGPAGQGHQANVALVAAPPL